MNDITLVGFHSINKIGEGTYGCVYRGKKNVTNEKIVIKHLKPFYEYNEGLTSTVLREIITLKSLRHTNLLSLLDIEVKNNELYLIVEAMDHDLSQVIQKSKGTLRPDIVKSFIKQILQGVSYMHAKNIAHRDLKPANILVKSDGTLKIADFGLSRKMTLIGPPSQEDIKRKCAITVLVATLWYRAPELLLNVNTYSTEIDMWSVGCIMSELSTGRVLFYGDSEINQIISIFKVLGTPSQRFMLTLDYLKKSQMTFNHYPRVNLSSLHIHSPLSLLMLIESCLLYDSNERITAASALSHIYFNVNY